MNDLSLFLEHRLLGVVSALLQCVQQLGCTFLLFDSLPFELSFDVFFHLACLLLHHLGGHGHFQLERVHASFHFVGLGLHNFASLHHFFCDFLSLFQTVVSLFSLAYFCRNEGCFFFVFLLRSFAFCTLFLIGLALSCFHHVLVLVGQ